MEINVCLLWNHMKSTNDITVRNFLQVRRPKQFQQSDGEHSSTVFLVSLTLHVPCQDKSRWPRPSRRAPS